MMLLRGRADHGRRWPPCDDDISRQRALEPHTREHTLHIRELIYRR